MEITNGIRLELEKIEAELKSKTDEIHLLRAENKKLKDLFNKLEPVKKALEQW